jgi:segregation and condensation protein B
MTENSAVTEDRPGGDPAPNDAPAVDPERLGPAVEAILLTLDKPVSAARLAEALGLAPAAQDAPGEAAPEGAEVKPRRRQRADKTHAGDGRAAVEGAIARLNDEYASTGRSFRIEAVAGGYRLMTLPSFAPVVAAFHGARASARLSRAAVETLAIIAYKQPLTRSTLEAIRGVACGEVLRSLLDRRLVTIVGRAEELGRPMLYGTTRQFLDAFGLASLKDLPSSAELQQGA